MKSWLMLSAVLVIAGEARSAPDVASAHPVMYGAGHKTCAQWSAAETATDQTDNVAQRFWIAGLMSGYNVFVSAPGYDIGKGLTPADMKGWMHDRCAANPSETVGQAGLAWIAHLKEIHPAS